MFVPMSVSDFSDRAVAVYGDRVGVIDESDQPAAPLGELTYAEVAALAARQAARLDELGIAPGDRVAIVSHNSARLLVSFFGVAGYGRVLVPVNFRLRPDEVSFIVAALRCPGPPRGPRARRPARRRHRRAPDRPRRRRRALRAGGRRPPAVGARRERHRLHQLHLGHDRPPQGRPDHPPQPLGQRRDVRAARGRDRPRRLPPHAADVPRERLGHAVRDDRPRRPPGRAAQGRRRRDPAPGGEARRHPHVRRPGGRRCGSRGRGVLGGRDPRPRHGPHHRGGRPPPSKTIARVENELGWEFIQIYGLTETSPLLTVNRARSEWDDLPLEEQATRAHAGGPPALGVRLRDRRRRARCWPGRTSSSRATGSSRRRPRGPSTTAGSTPVTAG